MAAVREIPRPCPNRTDIQRRQHHADNHNFPGIEVMQPIRRNPTKRQGGNGADYIGALTRRRAWTRQGDRNSRRPTDAG